MGYAYRWTHEGSDGGTWFAVQYPLGATRYYKTEQARATALDRYIGAIRETGGEVFVIDA